MKIAVRVPNWLGDAVMALPAVHGIARRCREDGDTLTIVVRPPLAPVFAGLHVAPAERGRETAALTAAAPDRILLLTHSFSTAWSAWRARIPMREGEGRHFRSFLLTKTYPPAGPFLHQVDEYSRLAAEAGYTPVAGPPRLEPRERPGTDLLPDGPYIVLAPGAKYGAAKRWPRFPELARALAEHGRTVVVLGAPGEGVHGGGSAPGDAARSGASLVHDLSGRTTLAEALAIVAHADAVVSNDSGLAHAAAALGRRTVVIFGPTDPERTAPRAAEGLVTVLRGKADCVPCLRRTCPIDHRCLSDLPVDAAWKALAP